MNKYMFRDLDHNGNFSNEKSFHAAGIVLDFNSELGKPCKSGKDVCVQYFDPFEGRVDAAWRSFNEIELFECNEWEYNEVREAFERFNLTADS